MEKGAIALLDVLGWKGIWQRNPNAPHNLTQLIDNARQRVYGMIDEKRFGETSQHFGDLDVSVLSISDTIALTAIGEAVKATEILTWIAIHALRQGIRLGLPMRGAISYGQMERNQNILIGPAVDEVASWYEQADWIGVMLTPTAMLGVDVNSFRVKDVLVRYDVPCKNGPFRDALVCNWPQFANETHSPAVRREQLVSSLLDSGPITTEIASKVMNTIRFYDHVSRTLAHKAISDHSK